MDKQIRRSNNMKKPNFDISGKIFAITGASGVLCGEMAREIAACGA